MKRPMATAGFSMLASFLIFTNITHKLTVTLIVGVTVLLLLFMMFGKLRKHTAVIYSLTGILAFALSFVSAEKSYMSELKDLQGDTQIKGVVCQEPAISDYAFSYIVKGENKNYKIRFVSEEDLYIREGDYVTISAEKYETEPESDFFESTLGSKVGFTVFASDGNTMSYDGRTNFFYRNVGVLKRGFVKIISSYLPGENGAVAKAMTVGDKSELDDKTVQLFNYCGTSHLLVISGLHLSVWSLGVIRLLDKSRRTRKISICAGLLCLVLYSALTGFTVSVIRAGFMVGAVLTARLFKRDADSINSVGMSLIVILLQNPFAPFSASLWLTVLSTVGILFSSEKLYEWINAKTTNRCGRFIPLITSFNKTASLSLSAAVFTLPVFVSDFKMLPTASVISNFLMVEAAMLLMVLTMTGVFAHLIFLYPVSYACFFIVGAIGDYLRFCAEKIGMWEASGISLNHRYYRYFLYFALISAGIVLLVKKHRANIVKPAIAVLSVIFIAVSVYCNTYESHAECVEVQFTNSKPIVMVCSDKRSLLTGTTAHTADYSLREIMNRHGEKRIDAVFITEKTGNTYSETARLDKNFGVEKFYFCDDALPGFEDVSQGNCKGVSITGDAAVLTDSDTGGYTVILKDKTILVIDCEKTEKLFQKDKMYDIIIIYGENSSDFRNTAENFLKANGELYTQSENKSVTIYS